MNAEVVDDSQLGVITHAVQLVGEAGEQSEHVLHLAEPLVGVEPTVVEKLNTLMKAA